jgi:multiple sugar transport system substrate-binding protein
MARRLSWRAVLGIVASGGLAAAGCGGPSADAPTATAPPTFPGVQLRGAVIHPAAPTPTPAPAPAGGLDPLVVLLNARRGEWEAQRQATVVFRAATAEGATSPEDADVVAFRADALGGLIDAGALAPIPEAAVRPPLPPADAATAEPAGAGDGDGDGFEAEPPPDPLAFSDILPAYRDTIARYGGELVALPFGGSAMVLAYRRDVLERPELKAAAKAAGIALEPPRTYAQLDALAKFLDGRDWSGDGQPDRGIALAFREDADGVATATYLARAAALAQHPDHFAFLFDDETMAPRIAWPPFVEALQGLAGLLAEGPDGMSGFDAEAARASYREGTVALLIDRADRASRWTDPRKPVPTGVARLPGSERVFDPVRKAYDAMNPPNPNRPTLLPRGGGWLVGVAKGATNPRPALDLVLYLGGADTAGHMLSDRAFPMLPVRSSLLGGGLPNPRGAPGVDARGWGRALAETLTAPRVVPDLRIPDADGYLADLAGGIAATAAGTAAPAAALADVERRWAARTAGLGVERQLWHYRRSLNRRTTAGSPPPRPAPAAPASAP